MEAILIKALNMSISATWLILAVMLLRLLLKKAPKWISVVLWGLVGLRLVLPFSLQSVFSLIPSAEVISPSIGYAQHPEINSGVSVIDNAVNPTLGTSLAATPMNSVNPMQIVLYLGGLVWVGGIAILLLSGIISYLRLRHKVTEAIPYEKNTWLCDQVKTPFILGVFRPRIYLPSGLSEEETAYVLAHEHAHLRRKDHLWKPLGFLLLTVYWFNPLVWLAYILLCRDIEAACDEKVISDMEMTEKKAYANALISCSMQRRLILACPLAFGEVGVKERVKGVLNYKKPALWIILIAIFACIVLAICLMTDPFSNKSLSGKLGISMDMAVAGHNHSSETEGHFVALDYDVLQVSKTANRTTVYAWVMYEEYTFDGSAVKEVSGSHIPTVITFDTSSEDSDKSTYDVIEYWEPRDGSYYADDIRAKFPWSIRRRAFDVSGADRQHENCLRAAREYFGIGQNTAESFSTRFYLTIGADNVKSIMVTTPYTSGGCQNADGSLYRKGELIWLEPLDGREDLRGVTITAVDASETVIWTASVPNTEENRGFTRLTQDGWTITNIRDTSDGQMLFGAEQNGESDFSISSVGGVEGPGSVTINIRIDVCELYLKVLEDLWIVDPGLNDGISQIGIDLSELSHLTELEKETVMHEFASKHNLPYIAGTWEELCEQGYIDKDNLYWEDGLFFSIKTNEDAEWNLPATKDGDSVPELTAFDAQKWRSGLGAYFFGQCTAQKNADGKWSYTVGQEAIS